MEWHFTDDRPIYQQIVEQMEASMAKGHFKAGQRLPGVRELASEAGVNPNTMQRALSELEMRGLVYTERTSGRFVSSDADKFEALRRGLALGLARDYRTGMINLGYGRRQREQFLTQLEDAEETG